MRSTSTLSKNAVAPTHTAALGQYMTPAWAAEALVNRYLGDLRRGDVVWEPTCGTGAFLQAIPGHIEAFGVEIDPAMAEVARRRSGRPVVVGDFRTAELPLCPTHVIGNPPFHLADVQALLERAHGLLPPAGRVGLILPCFVLQTAGTVVELAARWSIRQDMLPRNLFPGLSHPLCFAVLTKGVAGKPFNFALYYEQAAVATMQRRYRELLANGERSVWVAVTTAALWQLGGRATLDHIYGEVAGHRPTACKWWREKVRQTLQRIAVRTGPAEWALPSAVPRAA